MSAAKVKKKSENPGHAFSPVNWKSAIRAARGFFYRCLPGGVSRFWPKRLAGFERRWNLEGRGFTKEGFFEIFKNRFLLGLRPGRFVELAAGDGLVGSLGLWLEAADSAWCVEAWEHRPVPRQSIFRHRPRTHVHSSRLTGWSRQETAPDIAGITTRGAREATGVCRAIRQGLIRPGFLGIWNPTRRSVWEKRLRKEGYRLEMVYHRMEFFRDKKWADSRFKNRNSEISQKSKPSVSGILHPPSGKP